MPRVLLSLALLLPSSVFALTFGPERRVADTPRTSYDFETWSGVVLPRGDGWVVLTYDQNLTPAGPQHLVATPVDRDGQPHPEQQVVVGERGIDLRAAATPAGFLVSYNVSGVGAEVLSLDRDLKPAGAPAALPGSTVDALVCGATRCAASISKGSLHSLVLFDFDGHITAGPVVLGSLPGVSLAASGDLFIAGWASFFNQDASLAFIDAGGRILRSMVLTKDLPVAMPVVAAHPAGALVILGSTIAVVRMDGTIAGRTTLPNPGELGFGAEAVGDNGSEYLVVIGSVYATVSSVLGAGNPMHLYTVRLSHDLTLLDAVPRPVSLLAFSNEQPSVAVNGSAFGVGWLHRGTSSQATRVARIDAAGSVNRAGGTLVAPVPAPQFGRSLSASAQSTLAVWSTITPDGASGLRASRLDSEETVALSDAAGGALSATDGRDFLIAWNELDSVVIGLIPGSGRAEVRKLSLAIDATVAGLAWDGSGYMLGLRAIRATSDILVRIGADGAVMWSRPLPSGLLGIASLPGRTLALGALSSAIYGSDGSVLASVPIAANGARVASNGRDQFLVTSVRFERNAYRLFATRIDAGGSLLDGSGIEVARTTTSSTVAAPVGDDRWLLAWSAPDAGMATFPDLRPVTGELPGAIQAMTADGHGGVLVLAQRAAVDGRWTTPVIVVRPVTGEAPLRRRASAR